MCGTGGGYSDGDDAAASAVGRWLSVSWQRERERTAAMVCVPYVCVGWLSVGASESPVSACQMFGPVWPGETL